MTTAVLRRAAARSASLIDLRPALCIVLSVLGAIAFWLQLNGLLNHDTAWYLYATDRLLDGARLYVDIVELNPPLAFFLTVPPVWVARLVGLASADVFVVYVFVLAAGSLTLTRAVASGSTTADTRLRRWLLITGFVALVILPGPAFGQREHFIVMLGLPYLVLAAMRADGRAVPLGLALAVGVAGGLAFAIKPPFLLIPALIDFYLVARVRPRVRLFRPENITVGVLATLYAISVPLLYPEYLGFVVPLTAVVYGAYEATLPTVLACVETPLIPFAIAAVVIMRHPGAASRLAEIFLVTGCCAYVLYVVQMKGWQYQVYPVAAMLMLIAGVSFALLARSRNPSNSRIGRAVRPALVVAIVLAGLGSDAIIRGNYRNAMTTVMLPYVREHAAQGGLAVLSAHVVWGFPLTLYAGVNWTLRFPALWPLPGLVRARAAAHGSTPALDRLERYMIDAVIDDFINRPPAVVLVDVRDDKTYFAGLAFDYLEFFKHDPRFQRLWQEYELAKAWPSVEVYVRRQ